MSKAIITFFIILISCALTNAQDGLKVQNEQKAGIREQATRQETNSYVGKNSSMSMVAGETEAGPDKGGIVSGEARKFGNSKRHRIGHARPGSNQNDNGTGRQMDNYAAAFRHNGIYGGYAMRGALRCGLRGRR